jgi:hypothetical protein
LRHGACKADLALTMHTQNGEPSTERSHAMSDHNVSSLVRARKWNIRIAPQTMWMAAFITLTCLALIYVLLHAFQECLFPIIERACSPRRGRHILQRAKATRI